MSSLQISAYSTQRLENIVQIVMSHKIIASRVITLFFSSPGSILPHGGFNINTQQAVQLFLPVISNTLVYMRFLLNQN